MSLNIQSSPQAKLKASTKNDSTFQSMQGMSGDEIDAFIDAEVTSVPDIKAYLKALTKHMCSIQP